MEKKLGLTLEFYIHVFFIINYYISFLHPFLSFGLL